MREDCDAINISQVTGLPATAVAMAQVAVCLGLGGLASRDMWVASFG